MSPPVWVGAAFQQVLAAVAVGDAPQLKDVAAVGDLQRLVRVLLYQKEGDALRADVADDVKDLRDDNRREAERGFVQKQQFWLHHQPAADGEHLLFAAGEGASALAAPLQEAREELVDVFQAFLVFGFCLVEAAQFEVFFDGERREDAPSFGDEGDAALADFVRRHAGEVFAAVFDFAGTRARAAADGVEQGAFARAVRADEGDDFAFMDVKVDAFQRFDGAVVGVQVFDVQHQASPR